MQVGFPLPTSLIAAAMCFKSAEKSLDTTAFVARWVVAVVIENEIGMTTGPIKCLSYCHYNTDRKLNLSLYIIPTPFPLYTQF